MKDWPSTQVVKHIDRVENRFQKGLGDAFIGL